MLYKKFESGLISETRLLPKNVLAEFKSITPEKPNPALETDKTVEEINELLQKKINEYFTLIQNTYTNASQNSQLKILLLNQIISFITIELSYISTIFQENSKYNYSTREYQPELKKDDIELLNYKKKEYDYLIKLLKKYQKPTEKITDNLLSAIIGDKGELPTLIALEEKSDINLTVDVKQKYNIYLLIDEFKNLYDALKKTKKTSAIIPADNNELIKMIQKILDSIKEYKNNNEQKEINYDKFIDRLKEVLDLDYINLIDKSDKDIKSALETKMKTLSGGKRTKRRVKHKKMAKKHTRSKRAAAAAVAVKNRTKRKAYRHYNRIKTSIKKYKR